MAQYLMLKRNTHKCFNISFPDPEKGLLSDVKDVEKGADLADQPTNRAKYVESVPDVDPAALLGKLLNRYERCLVVVPWGVVM